MNAPGRGRFISFEGGEGTGKSTQARRLVDTLRMRGLGVVLTREPGGSDGAEAIRALLLGGAPDRWGTRAEALLFAAARADHVARNIRPALGCGEWVVCDRFVDSSLAYQGFAGDLGVDAVRGLHAIGSDGLYPDRTVLLVCDPAEATRRCRARDGETADRIANKGEAYHAQVAAGFETLATREPERFRKIEASGSEDEVAARVFARVEEWL